MPRGGRFFIRGRNVTLDEAYAAAHAGLSAGAQVCLEVQDTGEGMPEEMLAHVFEPFYMTKTRGRGTGLGLATVYGIVRQNGGHIEVQSGVGVGTTFHIHFPRCRELPLPPPALEGEARSAGRERILLVEDDDTVRRFALRALSKAGYQVQSASRPAAALELVHAGSVPFDLLLTDVMMPGMTGKDLADRLLAIAPALRVLYMSGYTQDAIAHQGILDPDIQFLAKPFTQENLCQRVREVLERV
jgi:CheY-like chemotaxis protein